MISYFTSIEFFPFAFPLERDVNPVEINRGHQGSRSVRPRREEIEQAFMILLWLLTRFSFTLRFTISFLSGKGGEYRKSTVQRLARVTTASSLFNEISPSVSFPAPFFPFSPCGLAFSLCFSPPLVLSKHFRPDRRRISAGRKIYVPAK